MSSMIDASVKLVDDDSPTTPSFFQRFMYRTLLPSVFVVPLFFVFGHAVMGGILGWVSLIYLFICAPILMLYHLTIYMICFYRNQERYMAVLQQQQEQGESNSNHHHRNTINSYDCYHCCSCAEENWNFYVSKPTAVVLVLLYGTHVVHQFFFGDFNDASSSLDSPAQTWFGLSEVTIELVGSICEEMLLILAVLLVVFVCLFEQGVPSKAVTAKGDQQGQDPSGSSTTSSSFQLMGEHKTLV